MTTLSKSAVKQKLQLPPLVHLQSRRRALLCGNLVQNCPKSILSCRTQVYFNSLFWFRVVCIHLVPCSALIVLTVLLVFVLRTAQRRKRQLMVRTPAETSAVRPPAQPSDAVPQPLQPSPTPLQRNGSDCRVPSTAGDAGAPGTGRAAPRRSAGDGNNTTLMLIAVVVVFLAVEVPSSVLLVVIIIQNTFQMTLLTRQAGAIVTLIFNLVILLSYPTNLFIYCAMSRAFRTTFAQMFLCRRPNRRVSLPGTTGNVGGLVVSGKQQVVSRGNGRCRGEAALLVADTYVPLVELGITQTTDVGSMRRKRQSLSVTQF